MTEAEREQAATRGKAIFEPMRREIEEPQEVIAELKARVDELERDKQDAELEAPCPHHEMLLQTLKHAEQRAEKAERANADLRRALCQVAQAVREFNETIQAIREAASCEHSQPSD